ncbi:MAG: hypothetical protein RLZZ347_309 [Candidatus Parcubacteria bacterium]|jgi:HSP20 family protein
MSKHKRSFFERLTGGVPMEDDTEETTPIKGVAKFEEGDNEGELSVDVHQTPSEVIIRAMVAGVRQEDLDVVITRDMVTIKCKRENVHTVADEDYFFRELYWGSFSRTILLPQEVEPDEAEATEKNGLLTIRLPKINKGRQTKLKIKPGN